MQDLPGIESDGENIVLSGVVSPTGDWNSSSKGIRKSSNRSVPGKGTGGRYRASEDDCRENVSASMTGLKPGIDSYESKDQTDWLLYAPGESREDCIALRNSGLRSDEVDALACSLLTP